MSKFINGHGKILLMDDDDTIRAIAKLMLSLMEYDVTCTRDGLETIEVYKEAFESKNQYGVVILDLTVHGELGGEETIKELRKINPEVKAIVCSGYSNGHVMSNFKEFGFIGCIEKPFLFEEMSKVLSNVMNDN